MKTPEKFNLTAELVTKVLETVDAGLCRGLGGKMPGQMCVEAAVCYAMGLPHDDEPPCVHPVIRELQIRLNDSWWSSKTARAKGMRDLAILQLGTADCGFDSKGFLTKLTLFTIKTILPEALILAGLHREANVCAAAIDLKNAYLAAVGSVDHANRKARRAEHNSDRLYATRRAAQAAAIAASAIDAISGVAMVAIVYSTIVSKVLECLHMNAAYELPDAKDKLLNKFAAGVEDILIEMEVPAVKFLKLIK